jgi:hypothetical protein
MMEAFMGQQNMPMMMPMMTQQMMLLQQQQLAAFNAMSMYQQPGFVPAPAPPAKKTAKSPPVKQETRNSPSKGAQKRRRDSIEEVKDEAKKSPARDTHSDSSPSSSPSCSPTPDNEHPKKDKDVKRQRRLIKNRESAQASRERKKIYVQGLEKRVDDLASTNTQLNTKVLTLEEENILLREKLLALDRDGSLAKELQEPLVKRRRLGQDQAKLPIPSLQQQQGSMNPFTNGFWNAFMSFSPPHMQSGGQTNTGATWNAGAQSKKVVLFVMLFCVAVLVFSNRKQELDVNTTTEHVSVSMPTRNMGRTLKGNFFQDNSVDESFHTTVGPILEAVFAQFENATLLEEEEEEEEGAAGEKSEKAPFTMELVKDKGLVLTFPLAGTNLADIKVEEGIEVSKTKQREASLNKLSKQFVTEICKKLEIKQH